MIGKYEIFRDLTNEELVRSLRENCSRKRCETDTPKREFNLFEEYNQAFKDLFENISLDLEIKLIKSESKKLFCHKNEKDVYLNCFGTRTNLPINGSLRLVEDERRLSNCSPNVQSKRNIQLDYLKLSPAETDQHVNHVQYYVEDGESEGSVNIEVQKPSVLHGNGRKSLRYMNWVLKEIVETEKVYVEDLGQIIEGYLLKWRALPKFCLTNHLDNLFGNIEAVFTFSRSFFQQLNECAFDPLKTAHCFIKNTSGFSVYVDYCTKYASTLNLLADLLREKQVDELFRERQSALGHDLPLSSYLLKPVQRILKYHLLLRNVFREYSKLFNDDGTQEILLALKTMSDIAKNINDMKKQQEQKRPVDEIKCFLRGLKVSKYLSK